MSGQVVIGGGVYLRPGSSAAASARDACQLPNPARAKFEKLVAQGIRSAYAEPPPANVEAWRRIPSGHPWAGGVALPRNAPHGLTLTVDRRADGDPIDVSLQITLRPYQRSALECWQDVFDGVVVAPCGAGKTAIGMSAVAAVQRRTLVLVHTLDLARQWVDRVGEQLVGATAGIVGGGEDDDGHDVVVATMQTLVKRPWVELMEWGKRFGLVICDEAHHVPTETICSLLSALPARRRLGLTATPTREDGMTPILWWNCGPAVFEITHRELAACGAVVVPTLRIVRTGWEPEGETSWSKVVGQLVKDEGRHELLLETVRGLLDDDRRVLVLSERKGHCKDLAKQLGGEPLIGEVSAKKRAKVLAAARDGSLRLVCGTTVADEGLDVPGLDAVVLATPTKALGRVEQRIGRIMRQAPGKRRPVVVDLVDAFGPMQWQAKMRRKVYTKIGMI